MKVGVLIPTRGDRPLFLENYLRMVRTQTHQPARIHVVDYKPFSNSCDISQRYKLGYTLMTGFNDVDVVAFMEDDDYYAPDYLETMVKAWENHGKPDIFGTNYTIYYHIRLRKYYKMTHHTRASAMNTLIKPGLKINWPKDDDPFTDLWLWTRSGLEGKTFDPGRHISIGIKHGVGLTGGQSHVDRLDRYNPPRGTDDPDFKFLKETIDAESFKFYSTYFSPTV